MIVLFQNSTTVKTESNKSDYDIIHENNELNRRKKKLRYGVTFAVAIPLFIVIYGLMLPRLFQTYSTCVAVLLICVAIGYLPSEMIVKSVFGNGTGTGEVISGPKVFKYVFTGKARRLSKARNERAILEKSKIQDFSTRY